MRKGAKVELDRERRLRYTLGAIEEIQERFGVDLVAGEGLEFGGVEDVAWLVCLGLRHAGETYDGDLGWWGRLLVRLGLRDEPEITEDVVANWIDLQNIQGVTTALQEAMGGAEVDPEDMGEGNPTRARVKASA